VVAADEPFERKECILRVDRRLALSRLADEPLAILRKSNDRRGRAIPLGVWDDNRIAALHHRDDRVRRPQVDTYNLCHYIPHFSETTSYGGAPAAEGRSIGRPCWPAATRAVHSVLGL